MSRTPRAWVFDLDNTLYPADSTIYDAIGHRMTAYIANALSLSSAEAEALQERYFYDHGATVVGLAREHPIDAADFMEYVHQVDMSAVQPDLGLNALIAALPGRKIVFTNGARTYAARVLKHLALDTHFESVLDLESGGYIPKPNPEAYTHLVARYALIPGETLFIEDTLRNLEPAAALGFETALVGPVHPDPRPDYVHHVAHDLKALLKAFS